jgi:hypothetical protein
MRSLLRILLRRRWASTATVVAVLGGGIGISAALFAVVDVFVLRPVSVPHPESLRFIQWHRPEGIQPRLTLDEFHYLQGTDLPVRSLAATREEIAVVRSPAFAVTAPGEAVLGDYFTTLGDAPLAGRFFDASETEGVIVLSGRLARRVFDDASQAIGQRVRLRSPGYGGVYDDRSDDYTVVGVARDDLAGTRGIWQRTDYWIPARTTPDPDRPDTAARLRFRGLARLQQDDDAAARLDAAVALAGRNLRDAAGTRERGIGETWSRTRDRSSDCQACSADGSMRPPISRACSCSSSVSCSRPPSPTRSAIFARNSGCGAAT